MELFGPGKPARVLLVEDDARSAMELGQMLRAAFSRGLVISHTPDVADATQELADHGATCVLLDVRGRAPLEALEAIGSASPTTPIIVLADGNDVEAGVAVVRAGAQDFLLRSELTPGMLGRAVRYAVERKRSEAALAQQALHDPLTTLPNRALFLDRLRGALDRSRRTGTPVVVLFLDVDGFKEINDTLGHGAGDRLLVVLAERFRGMLRPMDTVARFGGDEFTFLFEDLSSEREVVLIAERISTATSQPIRLAEGEASVTVSMGIAMVGNAGVAPETVLREADAAMYRAKELGRARYELFDESSRQRAIQRFELETALGQAIERGELRLHYQPKISLNGSPGVTGLEALVRWQHPERGLIAPGEFLPMAEETGMVLAIGEYVLGQALGSVLRWRRFRPDITVSVNLSFRQLEDADLATMVTNAMRDRDVPPGAVWLEVPERAVNRNPDLAHRALQALKSVGVGIAIDDYGTGASSLASLKRLPIDALKIHESFVTDLGSNPEEASLVGAVVELGHALGLGIVAEGVETDLQLAQLRSLGCDAAQGYLLGRPVPAEEVEALLVP
jgi:diguanylate cyclase (GGDEF)-like protein